VRRHRASRAAVALGLAAWLAACGPSQAPAGYRARSESYSIRISSDPMPPHAREKTRFTIVVRDRKTDQPIENGEGLLFAQNRDGKRTWDGLAAGPEVGTYYANLSFLTAGEWAMGIRFRRDSTHKIEEPAQWTQQVLAEREGIP
jgi:hypothetical protein